MPQNNIAVGRVDQSGHEGAMLMHALQARFSAVSPSAPQAFKVQAAHSDPQHDAAGELVERRYAERGYRSISRKAVRCGHELTLVADENNVTVATLTIGFDNPRGLCIDALFADEVNALRAAGARLCEFTRLAMDQIDRSTNVLASLFETAYVYAHRVMGFDKLLIEVNPRHVRYYERMYGFSVIGPVRHNVRVDAPAVLMCLDFAAVHARIASPGSAGEASRSMRSLERYHRALVEVMHDEERNAEGLPSSHGLLELDHHGVARPALRQTFAQ